MFFNLIKKTFVPVSIDVALLLLYIDIIPGPISVSMKNMQFISEVKPKDECE